MKKRICAVFLAAALTLSGCASMLNHDFVDVQPHADRLTSEEDPSIFRVGVYRELVNSILEMVQQGLTHGVIHLSNYKSTGDSVEADLAAACDEVCYDDPLGAYAVDFIKHDSSYIVSYYEANVYITYRRTQEQVKNIVSVTGSSAIRKELQATLTAFAPEATLKVSYFNEDKDYLLELARQAYYDTPAAALGMPEISVSIYPAPRQGKPDPGSGYRIVELTLAYPEDTDTLRKKSATLLSRAELLGGYLSSMYGPAAAAEIFKVLRGTAAYVPPGEGKPGEALNTAYAALVSGRADSEGMALAVHLFCQMAKLDDTLVFGALDGAPHVWNIIAYPGGEYRHLDASQEAGLGLQDAELVEMGYVWDREEYPLCGRQPPEPTPEPPPEGTEGADPGTVQTGGPGDTEEEPGGAAKEEPGPLELPPEEGAPPAPAESPAE